MLNCNAYFNYNADPSLQALYAARCAIDVAVAALSIHQLNANDLANKQHLQNDRIRIDQEINRIKLGGTPIYTPSDEDIENLKQRVSELQTFVDQSTAALNIINTAVAIGTSVLAD